MMRNNIPVKKLFSFALLLFFTTACTFTKANFTATEISVPVNYPKAEVVFEATLPSDLPDNDKISLEILDEVSGLAFNPTRYEMQPRDKSHFFVNISLPIGSLIEYRYVRNGSAPVREFNSQGNEIRYRLYHVAGPEVVKDTVAGWTDQPFKGPTGRLEGQVIDASTRAPIPDVMISIAGIYTITSSTGNFRIEGIQPGTHTLTANSLDGSYQPFQQQGTIAAESTTPATINMLARPLVNVTFIVRPPQGGDTQLPIRLVGNLPSLGNLFADLQGGLGTIASRCPVLTQNPDGTWQTTLKLPVGMDLHYKYSLGDGFWNSEQTTAGQFKLRQVIVPGNNTTIHDAVETWSAGGGQAVTIHVKTPANTPSEDVISIQFNPYTWTEPIPMKKLSADLWTYTLYGPFNMVQQASYRFCRNDLCGVAGDQVTNSDNSTAPSFKVGQSPQEITAIVDQWAWWNPIPNPVTVTAANITPRNSDFMAAIEVSPANTPAWLPYSDQGYAQIKNLSANTIILTPGWTYTALNLPALESKVGKDPQWPELLQSVSLAKQHQLNVAIYPIADTVQPAGLFWKSATKDGGWWQTWFDRYTPFLLNYADLAAVTQADMLILGEPSSKPSLAHGVLPNGGSSNSPIDSDARWNNILTQIRQHYRGKIIWAVTYPDDLKNLPTWVKDLDGIYILWNVNLSQKGNISPADFEKEITTRLTNDILPLQKELGKPVYVRFAIASANGGMANCLGLDGNCASMDPSGLHNPVSDQAHLNLQEQVDGYNAVFNSINQLNWVNGVSVAGYYLPANLQDGSPSVRGKPAASVVWYWFQKMTGSAK